MPLYQIPEIPEIPTTATIYIDPSLATHGNGTEGSPYNNIPGGDSTLYENTKFRFKKGTTLNQRVSRRFINCILESYGEGERPILNRGIMLYPAGNTVRIDGLHVKAESFWSEGWDGVINIGSSSGGYTDVTITNCIIEGRLNNGLARWYPNYGIKTDNNCHRFILYNNIIKTAWRDGVTLGFANDMKIVRNWFYDVNKMAAIDPLNGWGDAIEFRSDTKNLYLAGNLADKSGTAWKFSLIHVGGWDSVNRGIVVEYNTFIGGMPGNGGSVIFYVFPQQTVFRNNIVDATNKGAQVGLPCLANGSHMLQHLIQADPYVPRHNHFIKTPDGKVTWQDYDSFVHSSNHIHNGYSAYQTFMAANPGNAWGSDIDINDFWNQAPPPPIKLPNEVIETSVSPQPASEYLIKVKEAIEKLLENINYIKEVKNLTINDFTIDSISIGDRGIDILYKYNKQFSDLSDELSGLVLALNLSIEDVNMLLLEGGITQEAFTQVIENNINNYQQKIEEIITTLNSL